MHKDACGALTPMRQKTDAKKKKKEKKEEVERRRPQRTANQLGRYKSHSGDTWVRKQDRGVVCVCV